MLFIIVCSYLLFYFKKELFFKLVEVGIGVTRLEPWRLSCFFHRGTPENGVFETIYRLFLSVF